MKQPDQEMSALQRRFDHLKQVVALYGKVFKNPRQPKGIKKMRAKDCFANAYSLMDKFPDKFIYCEQFLPIDHACPSRPNTIPITL